MKIIRTTVLLGCVLGGNLSYGEIFREDFNSFYLSEAALGQPGNGVETDCDDPLPNCGIQASTDLDVFGWGWVEGWEATGRHAAHGVDLGTFENETNYAIQFFNGIPIELPRAETITAVDPAVMIWQNNVITLEDGIAGSNSSDVTCTLDFDASPAVYQAPGQVTTADDGLLIEVLRDNDSVLAAHTNMPGDWAGDIELVPDSFQYVGDGSGDIRLRVGPSNFGSGHFGGAIDNLKLTCGAEVFRDGFDGFNAPAANFNGVQFESGLPVAHSGDLPNWSKEGGGTAHVVDVAGGEEEPPKFTSDTNTMTLVEGIDANEAGANYQLSARIGPSAWGGEGQATTEDDFIKIQLLREDDSVLASFDARPEPWDQGNPDAQDLDGDGMLDTPVEFEYVGDGSGPVRIQIFGAVGGTRRFGGAIDDLVISRGALAGDYNESGTLDSRDIDFLTAAIGSDDLTFDANGDGSVSAEDRTTWVEQLANTWFGDSNLDREFNSSDLVVVFSAGKYELDEFAGWAGGDWNGDQRFGSGDLVTAFAGGGYEAGPRNGVAVVPEPSSLFLLGMGLLFISRRKSSHQVSYLLVSLSSTHHAAVEGLRDCRV
ncbi:MAG: PEP-CTERM sorting domain-containing protein [Pirellulaceae bacterium]|nr:PEP-CTERM sorting domain-containing protein [Pirellulaceae bacterium]